MPDFRYKAREMTGRQVSGLLAAPSERDVLSQLASQNLFPIEVRLAESAAVTQKKKQRRVPARLLAAFYTQLSDLLHSGVPLLRALELLERQGQSSALKQVQQEIREDVADGTRFAEAMRRHPVVFSDLVISIVRAGEEGSFLEDALQQIAEFTEHQEERKNKVMGAMAYPAFLLVVGAIVVTILLIYFVPQFEPMFEGQRLEGKLPAATTALLAASTFVKTRGWILALAAIGAVMGVMWYVKTEEGLRNIDQLRLTVPGIGGVTRSLAIARFCRILGTLLKNGVPLLGSLRIAKDATGNRILAEAIGNSAEQVSSGRSLAKPLAESKQFPLDVQEMIAVGEEANNLEQVLINISEKMERQTNRQLDLVVRLLEPMMLVAMAAIVLFVVVALMVPILQSSTAVQ